MSSTELQDKPIESAPRESDLFGSYEDRAQGSHFSGYPFLTFPREQTIWSLNNQVQVRNDPLLPRDEQSDYFVEPPCSSSSIGVAPRANSPSRNATGAGILDGSAQQNPGPMMDDFQSFNAYVATLDLFNSISSIQAMMTQVKESVEAKMEDISTKQRESSSLLRRRTKQVPQVLEQLTEQQAALRDVARRQSATESFLEHLSGDVRQAYDTLRRVVDSVGRSAQKYDIMEVKVHAMWQGEKMIAARALVLIEGNGDCTLATYEKAGRHAIRKSLVFTSSTRISNPRAAAEANLLEFAKDWQGSQAIKASVDDQRSAPKGRAALRCACIDAITDSNSYHYPLICDTRRYAQELLLVLSRKLAKRHIADVPVIQV